MSNFQQTSNIKKKHGTKINQNSDPTQNTIFFNGNTFIYVNIYNLQKYIYICKYIYVYYIYYVYLYAHFTGLQIVPWRQAPEQITNYSRGLSPLEPQTEAPYGDRNFMIKTRIVETLMFTIRNNKLILTKQLQKLRYEIALRLLT